MPIRKIAVAALLLLGAEAAIAADARPAALFGKLLECKGITDAAARLACYDTHVGALAAAEQRKDIVVVDREQMRATRKSLFGFTLPKLGLFGGGREDSSEEDVSAITSTIVSARPSGADKWVIVLADDGGTWETMTPLKFDPRAGGTVQIKKATMGSYLGSFGANRGVRFRRVN